MIGRMLCFLGFHDVSPAKREGYFIVTRCTRTGCLYKHTRILPWKVLAVELILNLVETQIHSPDPCTLSSYHQLRQKLEDWR